MPDDMWKNISRELDKDVEVAHKKKRMATRLEQWKPALAFAAAAGVFWLAIIPSEDAARQSQVVFQVAVSAEQPPGQNDVLPEVSRFVRTEKPAQDEPVSKKFGFTRYITSVQ